MRNNGTRWEVIRGEDRQGDFFVVWKQGRASSDSDRQEVRRDSLSRDWRCPCTGAPILYNGKETCPHLVARELAEPLLGNSWRSVIINLRHVTQP